MMNEEELLRRIAEMFTRQGELTARLVDEKLGEHMSELKRMVATAGDAGHEATVRAEQVEAKLGDHERRLVALEKAIKPKAVG